MKHENPLNCAIFEIIYFNCANVVFSIHRADLKKERKKLINGDSF
jgi:hypothetical protein